MTKNGSSSIGALLVIVAIITAALAIVTEPGREVCKQIKEWINPPPSNSPGELPIKQVVDDLRVLWSYERSFSYDVRHAATSMEELGDGTSIGRNGHVLKPELWKARVEPDDKCEPAGYGLPDRSIARYRFGIFPILSENGEKERFAAVLAALPPTADASDACFVALCGPADLTNDFSFDKAWPVYIVRAEKTAMDAILDLATNPKTFASLTSRFTTGDLSSLVIRQLSGWDVPENQ